MCTHGHTDVVHLLPVASYYGGNTDIHSTVAIAVWHVLSKFIVYLVSIATGYCLLSLLQEGRTPLHAASQLGRDDIVQVLIDKGAIIDRPSEVTIASTGWVTVYGI